MSDRLAILLPCRDQKEEFLVDAIQSVLSQTSPDWILLVILNPDSPPRIRECVERCDDPRVRIIEGHGGLARSLNDGLRSADTRFTSLLLSDDRYDPRAVSTLLAAIRRWPAVDFFHSGRRHIDSHGRVVGSTQPAVSDFDLDYFKTWGSPVKHLLCFRREKALEIGGMDESISVHACDDFDFPWRMAEAGCRFRAIPEILYDYRLHDSGPRLTTDVAVERQVATLEAIFAKHRVSRRETSAYVQRALSSYLIAQHDYREDRPDARHGVRCFFEAGRDREAAFRERGFAGRHFFPHRVFQLPKGGPDGLRLARAMCGIDDPGKLWEIVLYATGDEVEEFPDELFFDRELVWHEQQFGLRGQVASANVAVDGDRAFGMVYLSDLVQRISRNREFKSRIENRFKGWVRLLLNALVHFAADREIDVLFSPSAELALEHTDPSRDVGAALFERVYDRSVCDHFDVQPEGRWWRIDVARNRSRLAPLERRFEAVTWPKTISICHDTERGLGHRVEEPAFALRADERSRPALVEMSALERSLGVRSTYSVVGSFLDEVRESIEADGHACAFHSFDHTVARPSRWRHPLRHLQRHVLGPKSDPRRLVEDADWEQLRRCRGVDYRLKGYRAPQSRVTPGLSDANLSYFNFEWFASSSYSLGDRRVPWLENGIVKIPIAFDDYDLYAKRLPYAVWEEQALARIAESEFVALGLHDCYAEFWLPHYADFLSKLRALGRIVTLDEVAAETTLAASRWV